MKVEDLLIQNPRKSESNTEWIAIRKSKYPEAFKIARDLKNRVTKAGVNYFVALCFLHMKEILPILNSEKAK